MERAKFISSFDNHFGAIKDNRQPKGLLHKLRSILLITILASICGADEFTEIEEFGKSKKDFLSSFLDLKHGIPSHDTFGRVLAQINPEELRKSFIAWVEELRTIAEDIVPKHRDRWEGTKAFI